MDERRPDFGDPDDEENPWWDLRSGGPAERGVLDTHTRELRRELGRRHPMLRTEPVVIAKYMRRDEILLELGDDIWALVHLTWSGRRERGGFPITRILRGIDEVQAAIDELAAD